MKNALIVCALLAAIGTGGLMLLGWWRKKNWESKEVQDYLSEVARPTLKRILGEADLGDHDAVAKAGARLTEELGEEWMKLLFRVPTLKLLRWIEEAVEEVIEEGGKGVNNLFVA